MKITSSRVVPAVLAAFLSMPVSAIASDVPVPQTVIVQPGSFSYRASGEYLKDGFPVDAPLQEITLEYPVEIMKFQVSTGDYEQCVAEGACQARSNQGRHDKLLPVTGVSYRNALAYAAWLGTKTGSNWRLPTDEEWSRVAGNRLVDDAVGVETDGSNPAERWLAKYRKNVDLETGSDPLIKSPGAYGENEHGIFDLSGNIWEWTDTCYRRVRLDVQGEQTSVTDNCGVRIAAGQHRAYVTSFIQDAKGGGCSLGAPPDYLGFRLVREGPRNPFRRMLDYLAM